MTATKPILLAEDNPRDAELALAAMEEYHLADKVILCHDGAEPGQVGGLESEVRQPSVGGAVPLDG